MKENPYLEIRNLNVLATRGEIEPEEYGKRMLNAIDSVLELEKRP